MADRLSPDCAFRPAHIEAFLVATLSVMLDGMHESAENMPPVQSDQLCLTIRAKRERLGLFIRDAGGCNGKYRP